MKDNQLVPVWEKFMLTVKEASEYFNIGENKMYRIVNEEVDPNYSFIIQNGARTMIIKHKFENYLDNLETI